MYKVLRNTSVVVTGSVGAVICLHRWKNYQRVVFAESVDIVNADQKSSESDLELKQLQVFFRHGARTPLYVLEGFKQARYDLDLVMRPHTMTLFPYERVCTHTGQPCDWAPYEQRLRSKNLLNGGSIPGHLTSYGQEQMYGLGLRIRQAYGEHMGFSKFDPRQFFVLSTNITRTVESARCVMAGIYGNQVLKEYASEHGPIKLQVCNRPINILVPDTGACEVLRHVNHASMLHFDFVPAVKADRETVEKHIDEHHDQHKLAIENCQEKVTSLLESRLRESSKSEAHTPVSPNTHRQAYNQQLRSALQLRNEAIDQVPHFWHNAISHHPFFSKRLLKEDAGVLMYLRQIDYEETYSNLKSNYRLKFHFDPNPYFHDSVIVKEVMKLSDGSLMVPREINIRWKEGKAIPPKPKSVGAETEQSEDQVPFFSWLSEATPQSQDAVWDTLVDIWRNPLQSYKHISYKMDHSATKKINFIFLYDDLTARVTHGWSYPKGLEQFKSMTQRNGARMMYYAMTGRHQKERPTITSLSVGRLLTDMVERAESHIRGENPQRLCLYSSHDSTMVALLESLGLWQQVWPPFGSDVRLEIYQSKKTSQYFVRVLYLGEAVLLKGQADYFIPWDEFKKVVKPYMLTQAQFEQICASNFLEEVAKDVLEHEEGEVLEKKKSKTISETPAGM